MPATETTTRPPGRLIERFTITFADGSTLDGFLHATGRRGGRRIVVRDAAGATLHDTDDCYDIGNATAGLDAWLALRNGTK